MCPECTGCVAVRAYACGDVQLPFINAYTNKVQGKSIPAPIVGAGSLQFEIGLGNRPTTHFSKEGWKNLIAGFKERTGKNYDRMQMKNKWDHLKKDWKLWKELKHGETGLGWDPEKRTIAASEEWWTEKVKVFPGVKKFRCGGIAPDLEEKLNIMFSAKWIKELLEGHPDRIHDAFRMSKRIFVDLLRKLEADHELQGSQRTSSGEVLGITLYILAQGVDVIKPIDRQFRDIPAKIRETNMLKCQCRLLEFLGIPCRHLIALLKYLNHTTLPIEYIVHRWTRSVTVRLKKLDDGCVGRTKRSELSYVANQLIEEALDRNETFTFAMITLRDALEEIQRMKAKKGENEDRVEETTIEDERISQLSSNVKLCIKEPDIARPKGSGKRLKSPLEKQSAKARLCTSCKQHGVNHDKRNCPLL
ncbi:Protein FAR1-RELATED SEQUENCE 4 [Platanthera zijinensis]|uniref:Protein FAR1-RELATED SEQUENCE 4 n=1 Tax=Platanthera zijinensis TaxID=2320716 RepID=A0AAP0BVI1_9ASPA